jgi:hypothetical protein
MKIGCRDDNLFFFMSAAAKNLLNAFLTRCFMGCRTKIGTFFTLHSSFFVLFIYLCCSQYTDFYAGERSGKQYKE